MPYMTIYFILDCSGSMDGAKFNSTWTGVENVCKAVNQDSRGQAFARARVIWFNDDAHRERLVPMRDFSMPRTMQVLGKTKLGLALDELNRSLDEDIAPDDFHPFVFLFTDGEPDDDWKPAARRYMSRRTGVPAHTFCLVIGEADEMGRASVTGAKRIDLTAFKAFADVVMSIDQATPEALAEYFSWAGQSVAEMTGFLTSRQRDDRRQTIYLESPPQSTAINQDITGIFRPRPVDNPDTRG